jgi:hypothetical protein
MAVVILTPLSQAQGQQQVVAATNPPMQYASTNGNPNAQAIIPPYPTQPAHIDDSTGASASYTWNVSQQKWV